MKLNNLQDLYVHQLSDLYDAEKQILKALPKMMEAASSNELRSAFENHLEQTQKQVQRLERVFEGLGEKPKRQKCKGMEGLIEEGEELMEEDASPAVCDAGLIASAQKVEHYEIAGYGTVRTFAKVLGYDEAARLLQETLNEEAATDKKLTQIAEGLINEEAAEQAA